MSTTQIPPLAYTSSILSSKASEYLILLSHPNHLNLKQSPLAHVVVIS